MYLLVEFADFVTVGPQPITAESCRVVSEKTTRQPVGASRICKVSVVFVAPSERGMALAVVGGAVGGGRRGTVGPPRDFFFSFLA